LLPVFVESESKKIGNLHHARDATRPHAGKRLSHLNADIPVRVEILKGEYAHFLADPEALAPS